MQLKLWCSVMLRTVKLYITRASAGTISSVSSVQAAPYA